MAYSLFLLLLLLLMLMVVVVIVVVVVVVITQTTKEFYQNTLNSVFEDFLIKFTNFCL
jgi:ABC-type lipoprotein release transport system permease subunit